MHLLQFSSKKVPCFNSVIVILKQGFSMRFFIQLLNIFFVSFMATGNASYGEEAAQKAIDTRLQQNFSNFAQCAPILSPTTKSKPSQSPVNKLAFNDVPEKSKEERFAHFDQTELKKMVDRCNRSLTPVVCDLVYQGDVGRVSAYIDMKAEINHVDGRGWTPLMYAAGFHSSSAYAMTRLLLDSKASPNYVDPVAQKKENNPLALTVALCRPDICKLLLDAHAGPLAPIPYKDGTVLSFASTLLEIEKATQKNQRPLLKARIKEDSVRGCHNQEKIVYDAKSESRKKDFETIQRYLVVAQQKNASLRRPSVTYAFVAAAKKK